MGFAAAAIASAVLFPGMANAQSAAAGQEVFQARCTGCHTSADGGPNRNGPNLFGIMDSEAGSRAGFNYSGALASSTLVWTDDNMNDWLGSPRDTIPGNRMPFGGLSSDADRDDVVAFLRTLQ
jgi:cytochrome c